MKLETFRYHHVYTNVHAQHTSAHGAVWRESGKGKWNKTWKRDWNDMLQEFSESQQPPSKRKLSYEFTKVSVLQFFIPE